MDDQNNLSVFFNKHLQYKTPQFMYNFDIIPNPTNQSLIQVT
jgi:hypothetical protein